MENVPFDVEVSRLCKRYGNITAVDNFSLKAPRGSFTTLLGPSGCGKTTLLRIIAGFFEPDSGDVFIMGKNQRGIAPEERSAGIVFQDYALFPHMTSEENLAYGLKIRKAKKEFIRDEVERTALLLGLDGLLGRYPGELSGGQQQRLALGRAVILKPRVLLMDEPLSSLDAKLRLKVREELKEIQRALGITTIYVTHDQEEALALSDYIAVMHDGALEQFGSPKDVYNAPANAFAADFSGPANFFTSGGKKLFARPEWLRIVERAAGGNVAGGNVDSDAAGGGAAVGGGVAGGSAADGGVAVGDGAAGGMAVGGNVDSAVAVVDGGADGGAAVVGGVVGGHATAGDGLVLAGRVVASDFLGRLVRVRIQLEASGEIITAEIPPPDYDPRAAPEKPGRANDAWPEPGTALTVMVNRYREIT
jgi:ABC-type Fe3+/spermidine/putrescine transport system ATPase subunit